MKITFSAIGCGLEDSGGSDTIVKSANTLVDMGHTVTIIDDKATQYTWQPIKATRLQIHGKSDYKLVPDADALIATGYHTVRKTLHLPPRCGKKFHWIRGWETWNYPETYIKSIIMRAPVTRIVNGIQLHEKLKSIGVGSTIVRPGYDFDLFAPLNIRQHNKRLIIGGLYSDMGTNSFNEKKRATKRTEWIIDAVSRLKHKYDVDLWMYGTSDNPHIKTIDRYFKNPADMLKNEIYNYSDIWLAPTELEGLHMPPAEAMLTGCPVIGTNAELSGMSDYLKHGHTGMVATNDFASFVACVDMLINSPVSRTEMGKNAMATVLGLGSRSDNMRKLVDVLRK